MTSPVPSPMADTGDPLAVAADAENAAIFTYGVITAFVAAARRRMVGDYAAEHRARRDEIDRAITAAGGTPPLAAAGYMLPVEVTDPRPPLGRHSRPRSTAPLRTGRCSSRPTTSRGAGSASTACRTPRSAPPRGVPCCRKPRSRSRFRGLPSPAEPDSDLLDQPRAAATIESSCSTAGYAPSRMVPPRSASPATASR